MLVVRKIHNYLSPAGPYHPIVEEVRNNAYLASFRKWMTNTHARVSTAEIRDVQQAVENEIQRAQDNLFMKHLDPRSHYISVGRPRSAMALGSSFPGRA